MKKLCITLTALAAATLSQAQITIDDFDSYSIASINGQGGWAGTPELSGTGNAKVVVDPSGGLNQVVSIEGAGSAARGVYKSLGANSVAEGQSAILSFDIYHTMHTTGNFQLVQFGLSYSGNTAGFGGAQAYVEWSNGGISARNNDTTIKISDIDFNTWYSVDLVVNNATDTYDVFLDDVLVADDYVFRGGAASSDFIDIRLWAQASSGDAFGYVDNVTIAVPEPSTFALLAGVGALAFLISRRRHST